MRRVSALLLALALLAGCERVTVPARVDPEQYRSFFLWAGVKPQPVLKRAEEIYILAGEVRADDPGRIVNLRPAVPKVEHARVWLVVRSARLDWTEATYAQLERELVRWEAANGKFAGLQLDFDAATRRFDDYAAFLKQLRRRLPARHRLSITGLMDWSVNADPAALAQLKGTVDEVVVQSYQGRTTTPGYAAYLDRLARVPVPHKVALVQGGAWQEPEALRRDPLFQGYVVFLLNQDK